MPVAEREDDGVDGLLSLAIAPVAPVRPRLPGLKNVASRLLGRRRIAVMVKWLVWDAIDP